MKTQITPEMNRKHNRIALAYYAIMIVVLSLVGLGCSTKIHPWHESQTEVSK